MRSIVAAAFAAIALLVFGMPANAASNPGCWLVVYGMYDRAGYDDAIGFAGRIGEGVLVVDTNLIASLPKGRFAVVSGPLSPSDADATQKNTAPVAPNAIIVKANDCEQLAGVPGSDPDEGGAPAADAGGGNDTGADAEENAGTDAGEGLFNNDDQNAADAGEDASGGAQGPAPIMEVEARSIPVGKWPEGLAYDGKNVWVALSGQRQIAKIDGKTLKVGKPVTVGRLPVGLANADDVRIVALLETDKKIWQQYTSGSGKSGVLATVSDCPQGIASDGTFIWVATYDDCTSAASHVLQIDRHSGKVRKRYDLPADLFDISAGRGGVYTIHAGSDESRMEYIDPESGQQSEQEIPGTRLFKINASDSGLFAAGAMGEGGVVVSLAEPMGQTMVDQPVGVMTVTDDGLIVAVGEHGEIYVLGSDDLAIRYVIHTDIGEFEPHAVIAVDDRLYISTFKGSDADGYVLAIDHWRMGE